MLAIFDGRKSFYQWDSNQKLTVIYGGVCEVHYKQPGETVALVVKTYGLEGKIVADVPNILLQEAGTLTAYIYECIGDECTIHKAEFIIKPRQRPADYVYTETEIKRYSDYEERISVLEDGFSKLPEIPTDEHITEVAKPLITWENIPDKPFKAIGDGLRMDGDVLGVDEGECELIEKFKLNEEGLQQIVRTKLSLKCLILAIECPIASVQKDVHCSARGNNFSLFTGGHCSIISIRKVPDTPLGG